MRSTIIFVGAVLLVMFLGSSVHAKSDGSFGTDCASCHGGDIPGKPADPPTTPPDPPTTPADPPTTPPDNGQIDLPTTPPDDGQTDPPTTPPDTDLPATPPDDSADLPDEPDVRRPADFGSDRIFGAELSIVWDYGRADGVTDLNYVFIAAIETDTSVNLVELITKKGSLIQITDEPVIEIDNVVTQFYEDGDVRVWRYEARFADVAGLKEYGKGDFTIAVHHDQGADEADIQYKSKGKYKYKHKHKSERNGADDGLWKQDNDPDDDDDSKDEEQDE